MSDKNNIVERKPYIGITGFTDKEETLALTGCMPESPKRLLMVGVLANQLTLQGLWNNKRHPKVEKIKDIFLDHPLTLNIIHYYTLHTDTLYEQLLYLTEFGGPNLHGFQLNFAWPYIDDLRRYKSKYPDKLLVLVITGDAFKRVGYSPQLLIKKVSHYRGIVDYMLLDQSEGFGIPLNTEFMLKYLGGSNIQELDMNLVIAGGLYSETLYLIEPIIKKFPNASIDAEAKLRNKDDTLNLDFSRDYLYKSLKIFEEKI